jgi:beta-galactosidase
MHGTLIGADGGPVPLYFEVQQIGEEFNKASLVLAGTTVESQVAVLQDYPSRWAVNWQRHNKAFDPIDSLMSYYAPLHAQAGSVDIVSDTVPLGRYKLVVAPALNLLSPAAVRNLVAYVRGGGHLVLGQRSAMKDEDNSLFPERQPGPLAALLGARVEQFYALEKPVPVSGDWGDGQSPIWAEQIGVNSPQVKVMMRYGKSNGWLDNQPAAVTRAVGSGNITYIGMALEGATATAAAKWMLAMSGVQPLWPGLPDGVDLALRSSGRNRVFILTNYSAEPQKITLPSAMEDILQGGKVSTVTLPQYGVAVLR